MRKFLIGLVALVVLAVGAALIVPSFIDWNRYKGEIAARAMAATGRKLTIAGNLDLAVLPAPRLSVHDVRFANIAGGSAPDMARLKSLDVRVRLWPLLQGRVEVDSVTLVEPHILLEKLADGRVNWDIAPPKANAAAAANGAPARPGAPGMAGAAAPAFQLDRARIERGTLTWRDAAGGTEEKITGLTVDLAAGSIHGPFRVQGALTARGVPLQLDAALGALKPETASPVSLTLSLPAADAKAEISGSLAALAEKPRFAGKIDARGKDLARLLAAIPGGAAPPMLAQPFRLRASLGGTPEAASVENIDAELGPTRASGAVKLALGARPRADASLRVTRINLDRLLAKPPAAAPPAKPAAEPGTAAAPAPAKPFSLPAGIDATVALGIDAVTWNRQSVRDIAIDARLAGGQLALKRVTMLLPGGGEASLDGRLAGVNGRPTFEGKLSSQVDDLRGLLAWVGTDVGAVPSDRLRKFSVAATVRGNDQQIQLRNGQLSLDTTRIDFATTFVLRKRPAFGLTLNIGDVNLDAYMPRPGAARPAARPKPGAKPAPKGGQPAAPLAALNDFDANLVLRVASLTYNRTPVRDVRFNGTLSNGKLHIDKASVANFGGAHAEIAGTLGNFAGFPVFKGTVTADARDIGGVLRLAGFRPPPAASSLGALKLRGKADAGADKASFDVALVAAGGTARIKGALAALQTAPAFDGVVILRHKDLAGLIRTLGGDPGAAKLGPLALNLTGKGNLNALAVTLKGIVAGVRLTADGSVAGLPAKPAFKLKVAAAHRSTLNFARLFLPNYRPARGKIGPFSLNAELNGSESLFNLASLHVKAGALALDGSGKLATGGKRPALTASLKAGVIDLNPFRPRKKGGAAAQPGGPAAKPGTTPPGERFSSEKYDTTALGLLDADLTIAAGALIWDKYRVDRPTIRTTLADRLLTIREVSGRMYDGAFKLTGKLDGRTVPAVDGNVTVAKANVGKALFQTGNFDITGGITDFSMNATARGASPRAMVSALNGGGRIASVNGVVKGFDLKAVSDRLKNLDRALDFLSLFGSAMGGGQTKFSRLDGTFTIRNGVIRTNDMKLQADAGLGTAKGYADLPRWRMDVRSQFRLTEHPKAPPFGMRVVGTIDNPRRVFQFKELQTYLLQRGVGTLLRKAFPGRVPGVTSPAPAPQQQRPATKPRIEDVLPGLLKGLAK